MKNHQITLITLTSADSLFLARGENKSSTRDEKNCWLPFLKKLIRLFYRLKNVLFKIHVKFKFSYIRKCSCTRKKLISLLEKYVDAFGNNFMDFKKCSCV